eukprot:CAMPEP_0196595908 /NCGR_PEP_ID=MMETSP1081-20130531/83082_1 /TAXON_ID=36882 /ORGANISM="Pyramimonas amylifera, Strain CCMP720" /LENGTH=86 /DNA_ID=CAMNT_0041920687 /DNA_START=87 /DNA_END=347 /DNA_ORIENTATION=+
MLTSTKDMNCNAFSRVSSSMTFAMGIGFMCKIHAAALCRGRARRTWHTCEELILDKTVPACSGSISEMIRMTGVMSPTISRTRERE